MASEYYERRNARARALGYRSYYDYRIHNHGRIGPREPAPTGEARSRLRGHRGRSDLLGAIQAGAILVPIDAERNVETGEYRWGDILVEDERGRTRRFRLRGSQLSRPSVETIWARIVDVDADWVHNPSVTLHCTHGTWTQHQRAYRPNKIRRAA